MLLNVFGTLQAQQTLQVTTNEPTSRYKSSKWMTFDVLSNTNGVANYEISYDKFTTIIKKDTVHLKADQKRSILFTLPNPGSVIFKITQGAKTDYAGITFSPFDIAIKEAEPSNFDQFWKTAKDKLAATPIDAEVNQYATTTYSTTYRVNLGLIDQRRVYGYISIPNIAGPYSAVLTLPSFGSTEEVVKPTDLLAEQVGVMAMTISIHNAEPNERDPKAYQPDNFMNAEENYYRYAVLAVLRSIDYISSRSDFNGELALTGVSQGGGLAIMAAGLDPRVDLVVISNPTHCHHTGINDGVASGFPYYLSKVQNDPNYSDIVEAVKYYDAIYFARRYKGPVLAFISYEDQVTPTSASFAAFNEFSGQKIIMHGTMLAHAHSEEYWIGRYDAFRRFLPSIKAAPWPYARPDKGYWIDAGHNQVAIKNESITLQGLALHHTDTLTRQAKWEKLEGPGEVIFSTPNSPTTKSLFKASGKYILRYSVEDESLLATKGKYYTLMDLVEVSVEEPFLEPIEIVCPNDTTITTTSAYAMANWSLPKIISPACSEGAFKIEQTEGPDNHSMLMEGEWRISYRVYDNCNREGKCSFTVRIVKEIKDFDVKCNQDIRVVLQPNQLSVRVYWDLPIVSSSCEEGFRIKRTKGLPSGSLFTIGISEIVYEITDECGHKKNCTFYVIVSFSLLDDTETRSSTSDQVKNIISVYPNPAKNSFATSCFIPTAGEAHITVSDQLGNLRYETVEWLESGNAEIMCPVASLPRGWYVIEIKHKGQVLGRRSVVLQ